MTTQTTDAEYLIASKTAEEYRSKGYEVTRDASLDFFPDYNADLMVRKGGESKVIAVVNRKSLAADPRLREVAQLIESKPGWSFELILVGEPEKLDSPERVYPIDTEGVLLRLSNAEQALEGGLPEAAFLLAWSALEAAIRNLITQQGILSDGITTSGFLLDQSLSLGVLSREEYNSLTQTQKYRNAIGHGFEITEFNEELVADLIAAGRRLTAGEPDAELKMDKAVG